MKAVLLKPQPLLLHHQKQFKINYLCLQKPEKENHTLLMRYITKNITAATSNLSLEDKIEAVELSLRKLGLLEYIKFQKKPSKSGRKLTPMETRKAVWNFWHSNEHVYI